MKIYKTRSVAFIFSLTSQNVEIICTETKITRRWTKTLSKGFSRNLSFYFKVITRISYSNFLLKSNFKGSFKHVKSLINFRVNKSSHQPSLKALASFAHHSKNLSTSLLQQRRSLRRKFSSFVYHFRFFSPLARVQRKILLQFLSINRHKRMRVRDILAQKIKVYRCCGKQFYFHFLSLSYRQGMWLTNEFDFLRAHIAIVLRD